MQSNKFAFWLIKKSALVADQLSDFTELLTAAHLYLILLRRTPVDQSWYETCCCAGWQNRILAARGVSREGKSIAQLIHTNYQEHSSIGQLQR